MSFLQLISPYNSPSNFTVHFDDTIMLKKNTKIGLVSLSCYNYFNVDMHDILKNNDGKLSSFIKIGDGNTVKINIDLVESDFNAYDIHNIGLDELIEVYNEKLSNNIKQQYFSESQPIYKVSLKKVSNNEGNVAIEFQVRVDREHDFVLNPDEYEPTWGSNANESNNFDFTIPTAPKSDGTTTQSDMAYCVCEDSKGLDVNGSYLTFDIEVTDETWSFGLTHADIKFAPAFDFFNINEDETKIFTPVIMRCLGDDTGNGCTLEIYRHDNVSFEIGENAETFIGRFTDVTDLCYIELWLNANASVLFRCNYEDGRVNDILVDSLNQEYLFKKSFVKSDTIKPLLYCIKPNIRPISQLYWTTTSILDESLSAQDYLGWTEQNILFLPIDWNVGDFYNFFGYLPDEVTPLNINDNGKAFMISTKDIATTQDGIDKLNVHITNLPIKSFKNKSNTKVNGFSTTLLADIPKHKFGQLDYQPNNIIYVDLKNPDERINELNIQIRDATYNTITKNLKGSCIITIHLIN